MATDRLKEMTTEELKKELIGLLQEQFNLRMQKGMGDAPKPHLYKNVRREIARVKTAINNKERAA